MYINKIAKKFNLCNRSLIETLLLLEELIRNPREATKQQIELY